MAQKPRSQDNYQPGLVSATPAIQAIGGTNQAVVPSIPKDNTYLRLSRSLSQFSNLLGQVSNINQMRGKDFAQGLSAEELDDIITGKIPDPEGGPLGALGFQKAFQQTSAKRWYETVGVQKYADLENTIDAKLDDYIKNGYDINKAKALVQEDIGALSMEIQEYFADKEWGGQVSNLLGGELSSRVMAGALKGYEKKQKAYLLGVFEEKTRNEFAAVALGEADESTTGFFKRIEKEFKTKGYSPKQITNFYNKTLTDGLNLALGTNPDRAAVLITDAEKLKINGRPVFGGMDSRLTLTRFKNKLDQLDSESSTAKAQTVAAAASQFVGGAVETLKQIKRAQDGNKAPIEHEAARQALILTLQPLNLTGANQEPLSDVAIANIVETVLDSPNPQGRLSEILIELAGGQFTSAFSREVITRSFDDISEEIKNMNLSPSSQFEGVTAEKKQEALKGLPGYFEERTNATPAQFMNEHGVGYVAAFEEVEAAHKEARKFDNIIPTDDEIKNSLSIALTELSLKYKKYLKNDSIIKSTTIRAKAEEQVNNIKSLLIKFGKRNLAPEGVIPPEGSKDSLRKEFEKALLDEKEDFERLLKAMSIRKRKTRELFLGRDIEKENVEFDFGTSGDTSFYDEGEGFWNLEDNEELAPYKTLNLDIAKKVRDDKKVITKIRDNIETDIKTARLAKDEKALSTLLKFYGLDGFDKSTIISDFEISNTWWDEVKIFPNYRSLKKTYDDFASVIVKATKDETLSTEEQELLDVVVKLGLYEESLEGEPAFALEQFLKVQQQFFQE